MKHTIYLCEECLECKDPDLFCKFRPSCPIYFISKKGFGASEDKPGQKEYQIVFEPGGKTVVVKAETTLFSTTLPNRPCLQ